MLRSWLRRIAFRRIHRQLAALEARLLDVHAEVYATRRGRR